MGNFSSSFKRLIANKNTITILGLLIGVAVIVVGYYMRIEAATKPVTLWVANKQLEPQTIVTQDMLTTIKMPEREVRKIDNIIRQQSLIVGKAVHYNTTIPKNGFFYTTSLLSEDDMPDSVYGDMPDGHGVFILETKNFSGLEPVPVNRIMPGQYIDIYFMTKVKSGVNANKWAGDYFLKSVQVKAVEDSQGRDVFKSEKAGTPTKFYFTFEDSLATLLSNAVTIDSSSGTGTTFKFIPRPRNKNYTEKPAKMYVDEGIRQMIANEVVRFSSTDE